MPEDTLLWDRKETRRQLGGASDSFLDALVSAGHLSPVFRGRYLPDEVRSCVASLVAARNRKSLETKQGIGNEQTEGRTVSSVGANCSRAEGSRPEIRQDSGRGGRQGAGVRGGGSGGGYPTIGQHMASR